MSGFLLDTNILSEFARRGGPDPAVKQWLATAQDPFLFTSVLTLAEIRRGIELLDTSKRRTDLEQWFNEDLLPAFEKHRLPVSQAIADRWAVLSARLQRQGTILATIDGLIAATALEHDLAVVTRNVKDFVETGVPVVNPWESGT